LGLSACGFNAPAPKRTPPPPTPPIPISTISATIVVPARTIADTLNANTRLQIARLKDQPVNCGIGTCKLNLVALRAGDIAVRAEEGQLAITMPFVLQAQMALNTHFFLKTKARASATGTVDARTIVVLTKNWEIEPHTFGTVKLSEGKLKLGPMKMSLADVWNHNSDHLSRTLFDTLDKHIATDIRVKHQAEQLWGRGFRPVRVGKAPQAWLMLDPQTISISTPQTMNGAISISLALNVQARVTVGNIPPAPAKIPPLPQPSAYHAASNQFSFVVPALLPYGEAAKLAQQRLEAKPLHVKGMTVRFKTIAFLPSGQDVIVQTHFCVAQSWDFTGWFDSCGTGYLRGRPVFDAKSGMVRIADVHYDIATAGVLLATMRLLAGDALGKALEPKLVFSVTKDIGKLQSEIRAALAKPQGRGLVLSGIVDSFGTPVLTWTKDGFLASFSAQGRVKTSVDLSTE
jgi:hypothetical protein